MIKATPALPVWPYPGLLAALLTTNLILRLWLVLSLNLWFWGRCDMVFLSSTRHLHQRLRPHAHGVQPTIGTTDPTGRGAPGQDNEQCHD